MSFFNSSPDKDPSRSAGRSGPTGPFVGIGVPVNLAQILAAGRPLLLLEPEMIASAGLHRLENPLLACLLLGTRMDALDVIAALVDVGYRGQLAVLAPPLPNASAVERELAALAIDITINLVEM